METTQGEVPCQKINLHEPDTAFDRKEIMKRTSHAPQTLQSQIAVTSVELTLLIQSPNAFAGIGHLISAHLTHRSLEIAKTANVVSQHRNNIDDVINAGR